MNLIVDPIQITASVRGSIRRCKTNYIRAMIEISIKFHDHRYTVTDVLCALGLNALIISHAILDGCNYYHRSTAPTCIIGTRDALKSLKHNFFPDNVCQQRAIIMKKKDNLHPSMPSASRFVFEFMLYS